MDNELLRYRYLNEFDRAMVKLAQDTDLLAAPPARPLNMDEKNQVMAFERGGLVFVFNWSGTQAIPDYKLPAPAHGEWRVALDSDDSRFGGFGRQDHSVNHFTDKYQNLSLYLLPRTVLVLARAYRGGSASDASLYSASDKRFSETTRTVCAVTFSKSCFVLILCW